MQIVDCSTRLQIVHIRTYMDKNTTEEPVQVVKVQTGVSLPADLWQRTRVIGLRLNRPAQDIVAEALEAFLPKLEKKVEATQ